MNKKGVAIHSIPQVHYTDHLAVMCIIMGVPLLYLEPHNLELGLKYYPGLKAFTEPYDNINPDYLTANYDILYVSDQWDRDVFHKQFYSAEQKYRKVMRYVHVPHGFSDKRYYFRESAQGDITLIYGQNMIDLLKSEKVFEDLHDYVITGNYRYTYFKQHRKFFDKVMEDEVLHRFDKKRPIILYAPTWSDIEESSTFFDVCSDLIDNLPESYNMIVKPHPLLENEPTMYYPLVGRYKDKKNVIFLENFPLVYPLLAHADIYIGDKSSVGYDFLVFNKPMYFLNKFEKNSKTNRGLFLFRCGVDIKPDSYSQIYKIIEATLPDDQKKFSGVRSEVYDYTFGTERGFEEIKADILRVTG